MDLGGIVAMSMDMKQVQLQQAVSISVTKKAMESAETQASSLLEMLPPPQTDCLIDVHA